MRLINLLLYGLYGCLLVKVGGFFLNDWEYWVFLIVFTCVDLTGRIIGLEDK